MTSESEKDISLRLIREVIRGKAIRIDRRIWVREWWEKVDDALDDFEVAISAATIWLRKAEEDSDA
jgi:hypothetical protein